MSGPWNSGERWKVVRARKDQAAVDGGDGTAAVKLKAADKEMLLKTAQRTASATDVDPMTGAELGSGEAQQAGKE
jgi:Mn-containing catalase